MKYLLSFLSVFLLSFSTVAQSIHLKGTLYDPTGAVVVGAEILAISTTDQRVATTSKDDGSYLLELIPGRYRIEFYAPGFRRTVWNDYTVVNATFGAMNVDVVLFVQDGHEACGYGGHCIEIPISKGKDVMTTKETSPRPKANGGNTTNKKPR
jgi:hypothetical protein